MRMAATVHAMRGRASFAMLCAATHMVVPTMLSMVMRVLGPAMMRAVWLLAGATRVWGAGGGGGSRRMPPLLVMMRLRKLLMPAAQINTER